MRARNHKQRGQKSNWVKRAEEKKELWNRTIRCDNRLRLQHRHSTQTQTVADQSTKINKYICIGPTRLDVYLMNVKFFVWIRIDRWVCVREWGWRVTILHDIVGRSMLPIRAMQMHSKHCVCNERDTSERAEPTNTDNNYCRSQRVFFFRICMQLRRREEMTWPCDMYTRMTRSLTQIQRRHKRQTRWFLPPFDEHKRP